MAATLSVENWLLLLALTFLYGLAFEEHYAQGPKNRPGGIRTFPLLGLSGALLYLLDPLHLAAFVAGLVILGVWLNSYYRARLSASREAPEGSLIINASNLLAYVLGPVTLTAPHWLSIGCVTGGVALLSARQPLHHWATRLPKAELYTLIKFLVLAGIVLPLLPTHPVTQLTSITPHQVWLAVVVVSALSYGSYLIQRYVSPDRGLLLAAILGGIYSSTATTVMLARTLRASPEEGLRIQAAMLLATAMMYLRLIAVAGVFDWRLGMALLMPMLALSAVTFAMAIFTHFRAGRGRAIVQHAAHRNPLELLPALVFAGLFVLISIATAWVQQEYGQAGLHWLAVIVGFSDIDPFVLSIAQGSIQLPVHAAAMAIVLAASSNNLLKAAYALGFSRARISLVAATGLLLLAGCGFLLVAL